MVLVIKFVIFELVFNLTLYLLYECRGFFYCNFGAFDVPVLLVEGKPL